MLQNNVTTVETVKGSDILLHNYGTKIAHGHTLNSPERIIAVSEAAMKEAGRYGPTAETFQVKPIDLPESTKGVLADYAS